MTADGQADRTSVAVVVCTFRRPEPLRVLLRALGPVCDAVADRAVVGVVVVDDDPAGSGRATADAFADAFELGLRYEHTGSRNISTARNRAIEAGAQLGDWVAMTDDDCEPVAGWLAALLDAALADDADCATGPMVPRMPPGSARWLTEQPFTEDIQFRFEPGARVEVAATNNSMIRARFLLDHPDVRFEPQFGVVGGEDMVFYRSAAQRGLHIRYAPDAVVYANEPPSRATMAHQVRYRYWLGNSEALTNLRLGTASRARLAVRALRRLARCAARPWTRLARREAPQFRYAWASAANPVGMLTAVCGVRVAHPQD